MNILIIHNSYQIPGGEDEVVRSEKGMLEQFGHKVVLYARSNDEIEKLLHVSDATTSRCTKILVARGILRKEGRGRGAHYTVLQTM